MQIRTQHFKRQDWVNGKGSLEKDKIKFLLVEGVHQKALKAFVQLVTPTSNFTKARWMRTIKRIHPRCPLHRPAIPYPLTEDVINAAEKLVAIGCFCMEQTRLIWMRRQSAGSRYLTPVLKYALCCGAGDWRTAAAIRGVPEANAKAHRGVWNKLAAVLLKRAAKSWVSSATVILVPIGHSG